MFFFVKAPCSYLRNFCTSDNGSSLATKVALTPVSQGTLGKSIAPEEHIFISFLHGSTSLLFGLYFEWNIL
jgi:hypothetical protein